jgi:hypothetical protein
VKKEPVKKESATREVAPLFRFVFIVPLLASQGRFKGRVK